MSESNPEQIIREQEQAIIDDVYKKRDALTQYDPIKFSNKRAHFIYKVAIPALRKKYGEPKAGIDYLAPEQRIVRYKLYHAIVGGSGYDEPFLDLDPDLEGQPSFQRFIDDLYKEWIENNKQS